MAKRNNVNIPTDHEAYFESLHKQIKSLFILRSQKRAKLDENVGGIGPGTKGQFIFIVIFHLWIYFGILSEYLLGTTAIDFLNHAKAPPINMQMNKSGWFMS